MNKIKIFIVLILLFLSTSTYSKDNTKSWQKKCSGSDSNNCFISIEYKVKTANQEEKQLFATAYIKIGSKKQKTMSLIDKEDQTYKLGEANKPVTIMIINLPLNTDLRKNPLISSDKLSLGNPKYVHCNKSIGCKTMALVDEKVIEVFKKGKSFSVTFGIFGNDQNMRINFPLKGFTKAYDELVKG